MSAGLVFLTKSHPYIQFETTASNPFISYKFKDNINLTNKHRDMFTRLRLNDVAKNMKHKRWLYASIKIQHSPQNDGVIWNTIRTKINIMGFRFFSSNDYNPGSLWLFLSFFLVWQKISHEHPILNFWKGYTPQQCPPPPFIGDPH